MAARTNFPGLKQDGGDTDQQIANVVNNIMNGKLNCTIEVTLRANQTTTDIDDPRIYSTSVFLFDPRTANARAALFSMYISAVSRGSATITHTNTATTDRTFIVGIFS
jgi:hypothetical protein